MSTSTFSQERNDHPAIKDKHYYQSLGSDQLVTGFMLLAAGITGIHIANAKGNDLSATPAFVTKAAIVGGAILIISSANSKKKARTMNAFLKMETVPVLKQCSIDCQYFPSLCLVFHPQKQSAN